MYFFYFYPLGLDRPLRGVPVVTRALEVLMVLAFLWTHFAPRLLPISPWQLVFIPGNDAPWTVVTAMFLHVGWLHLLGNLLYFHVFGPPLESRLGGFRFLVYLLLMGAAGNTVHGVVAMMGWFGQSGMGVLGASGAIAGLLSFSLVRFYDAHVEVGWWVFAPLGGQNRAGRTEIPVVAAVGAWLLLQVVQTLAATETGSSTSFGAHFGGFFMGLFLGLTMGQFKQAKAESKAATARRYQRRGQTHAAIGAWLEYLELEPTDEAARLELGRVRCQAGQLAAAGGDYRWVFNRCVDRGDVAAALEIHREAARGPGDRIFRPEELAKVAYYREKLGDDTGALDTYESLFWSYPDHPEGHRALVRVIVLLHGKVADPPRAREFLAEAARRLPRGGWRHFLNREFNLESAPDAGPAAPPAAMLR